MPETCIGGCERVNKEQEGNIQIFCHKSYQFIDVVNYSVVHEHTGQFCNQAIFQYFRNENTPDENKSIVKV